MSELLPETYTFSIPGTDQTEELPRGEVLARMARGQITPQHWVWSPEDNDWKQVGEIPSLQAALPVKSIDPEAPILPGAPASKTALGPLGPIAIPPIVAPPPETRKKKSGRVRGRSAGKKPFPLAGMLSILGGALFTAAFAVAAFNYQFIDLPLNGSFAQSPFVLVSAHAHLDDFVQSRTLVIHVVPTSELTADNFADFLFTLAKSTPTPPFKLPSFTTVELTPSWLGQYAMTGADWRKLAQMDKASSDERRDFVLAHLTNAAGQPLAPGQSWDGLLGQFQAPPGSAFAVPDWAKPLLAKLHLGSS
jgi:hypothetical protein